jgi:hypothetical protein
MVEYCMPEAARSRYTMVKVSLLSRRTRMQLPQVVPPKDVSGTLVSLRLI